mmetsp:Transcript_2122/g.8180  ORF Transcript_2122/g.8180 Transcript_2122/m.8180 type:complete len:113 (+) Transcript_2122:984-1322(+)
MSSKCSSRKSLNPTQVPGGACVESIPDRYRYWLARRSNGLRLTQKEFASTPLFTSPLVPLNAGGNGGRCQTLQLNPGTVEYPKSNSKFPRSVAAHMPSLLGVGGKVRLDFWW